MPGCFALLMALLGIFFAALRPIHPYEVPPGQDVYSVVAGTWDWAGRSGTCRDNSHTISFSADRKTMLLTTVRKPAGPRRETQYEIRDVRRSGIRGFITGETRLTEAGEPVVWDLVLTSADSYRWHRTDWSEGSYTGEVVRCPAELAQ